MSRLITLAFTFLISVLPATFAEVITDWTMEKITSQASNLLFNLPLGAYGVAASVPPGGSYAEMETPGPSRAFIVRDTDRNVYFLTTSDEVNFDVVFSSAAIPAPKPPFNLDDIIPPGSSGKIIKLPADASSPDFNVVAKSSSTPLKGLSSMQASPHQRIFPLSCPTMVQE